MKKISLRNFYGFLALVVAAVCASGCASSANNRFFGETSPPKNNVLRYISGSEPESLDPQIPSGQPEARIFVALYEGLVEYDPKTMQPVPALAESWEISPGVDEFVFHLRKNGKWSNGDAITAKDFVYSLRRGFAPETLSRTASLGYPIKYSEAFNGKSVFVKKGDQFLLARDFAKNAAAPDDAAQKSAAPPASLGAETEFNKFIKAPERLVLDGDEKKRAKIIDADPKLKAALEGAEFVTVNAADIGVEAIDDYTVRITLRQPAPYFLGLLAHQFFRLVPQKAIEQSGSAWTRPENIVTCGAFKIKVYKPYDILSVEKDQNYWDAANVKLDGIDFYPVDDQATMLNLYKSGNLDAMYNHSVPVSWIDEIRNFKDEYLIFPENATSYYSINMKKAPFDNLKVRQAFNIAIDRDALVKFRKVTKPLYDMAPAGIFPEYDQARAKISEEMRQQRGVAPEEWDKRNKFNPEKARQLLAESGFPVQQNGSSFSCPGFPLDKVSITYNTLESNRQVAEFIQSQWKQNLGITVPLKNMEFKTFIPLKNAVQFDGFAQTLWSGDYVDPFTFLNLHYGRQNDGSSGFYDPKYDEMLDAANSELDPTKRYEQMARAEFYLMEQLPMIPLQIQATNWLKKPYVKGMYPNSGTLHSWKYVYLERDPAKWDTDVENIMK